MKEEILRSKLGKFSTIYLLATGAFIIGATCLLIGTTIASGETLKKQIDDLQKSLS